MVSKPKPAEFLDFWVGWCIRFYMRRRSVFSHVAGIIGIGVLLGAALQAETFRCSKGVPAYDPANSWKTIGTFNAGSELELGESVDAQGMVAVSFRTPDGKVIQALCQAEDVGKGKAPKITSTGVGGGRSDGGGESGFAKTEIYKKIQSLLVDATGQAVKAEHLAKSKHVLLYFSAHWCPPCRAFTPELVKFYKSHENQGMEVVFVSSDHSAAKQLEYMKELKMPWVAIRYDAIGESQLKKFCGRGIPCLVALDEHGAVYSDSYAERKYIGPHKVLQDVEARLTSH